MNFNFLKKKKVLVTHNGSFHADDIFACATMTLYFRKYNIPFKIIRTRDESLIKSADYVFDVGGIYDHNTHRYDHHQKEGSGRRTNSIPYASFGLAWKHFGMEVCNNNENVWKKIDEKIASSIDAVDNGLDIAKPIYTDMHFFSGSEIFLINSPTWKEDENKRDDIFLQQVKNAVILLQREIKVGLDDEEASIIFSDAYKNAQDKRLIILDHSFPRYLLQDYFSRKADVIYLIYPGTQDNKAWKVEAVSKSPDTMESRKLFPESWRGLFDTDAKIREVTGVSDALFCHRSGFLIFAKSKEGAIALAKKALES